MVAAGIYLVGRMFPLFELGPGILTIISIVGIVTFILAGAIALVMTDIKRVLAYSTISHLGLMMLSLGSFGAPAAFFHLVIHGFSKALLQRENLSIEHEQGMALNQKRILLLLLVQRFLQKEQ